MPEIGKALCAAKALRRRPPVRRTGRITRRPTRPRRAPTRSRSTPSHRRSWFGLSAATWFPSHIRVDGEWTLDRHNPARSDGRHREIFSGGRRKKEKTGPAREPVRRPCLFADAEGAEDEIQTLPQSLVVRLVLRRLFTRAPFAALPGQGLGEHPRVQERPSGQTAHRLNLAGAQPARLQVRQARRVRCSRPPAGPTTR